MFRLSFFSTAWGRGPRGTVLCVLWARRRGGVSLGGVGTTCGREECSEALETPRTAKVAKIAKNDSY
jgi:hypothetical protein